MFNLMKNQGSSQQIRLGFKVIILSMIIMLAIILTGIYSMKFIIAQQQVANYSIRLIDQIRTANDQTQLHLHKLTGSCTPEEGTSLLRDLMEDHQQKTADIEQLGKQGIEKYGTDKMLFNKLLLHEQALSDALESIQRLCETGSKAEAALVFDQRFAPLLEEGLHYTNSLREVAMLRVQKLDNFSAIVLNGSMVSLLFLGILQIVVASRISKGIMAIFRKILKEIREGVAVVGTSSAEIQTTVAEISTGASETATAIMETTTTLEEIRQTSMMAHQKSMHMMQNAQQAYEYAEQGLESSNQMIDAIQQIESKMEIVSNTIKKLVEQNRSIGDITATVSDIADQSNLLAVNAAIEAAKAGEHGRGFTIVAQEIRSLAEQSKKSTQQVKTILSEINHSVQDAVDAIREGSSTVHLGTKMVHQDRQIVEMLTKTVEQAHESSIQISSSSQQQMAGMDQIVPAMDNIRLASEQNLQGIRQAELAAKDINTLGTSLNKLIEKYTF